MKTWIIAFLLPISIVVKAQIITTVAGGASGHGGYWGEGGPATLAQLPYFAGIVVDGSGNIYLAGEHRLLKVSASDGNIKTIAGTGTAGYNGDNILATVAQLNSPVCVSLDHDENIYVYDAQNNRIRKIHKITGIITTYAGNGIFGFTGDTGPATTASIDGGDMAWDMTGNLYFTSTRKIRKITPSGTISTFVGNGLSGITGEGVPATATYIAPVRGLAIDNHGNLYLADSTKAIRKITASTGLIYRIAGTGDNLYTPYTGDGIPATSCRIDAFDISVDDTANIYIADAANSRIEKVDTFGIINTIAGTGVAGFSGDLGIATAANIQYPENVVLDKCGNIYIADFGNKRVRKVTFNPYSTPSVTITGISTASIGATVTVNASVTGVGSSYSIKWMNKGIQFATTTVPTVTYTKAAGIDTITARVVPAVTYCYDSTTSAPHYVSESTVNVAWLSQGVFSVFPNPGHNTLTISGAEVINSVTITNLVGEVLINEQPNEEAIQISIEHLPLGMYLLRANNVYVQRFMKE